MKRLSLTTPSAVARPPGVIHPGPHFKMGQTVTFTVQLLDEDGDPVGPTPGVRTTYFEVKVDTFRENADAPVTGHCRTPLPSVSLESPIGCFVVPCRWRNLTGEVYEGPQGTGIDQLPTDTEAGPTDTMPPRSIDPRECARQGRCGRHGRGHSPLRKSGAI